MIDWTLAVSVASLAIVIVGSACGVVWKLSRSEISMRSEAGEKFTALQLDAARKIAEVQLEAAQKIAALSDKLYQVEIWSRDQFVRKGSFEVVVARMEKGISDLRTEIAGRLDKVADRLDHLSKQ